MIVQCVDIYNIFTKEYIKGHTDGSVTKGKHYNVLEINFDIYGVFYRTIGDDGGLYGHSVLSRAQDFKIISARLPSTWILLTRDGGFSKLSPAKWANDSLWEWSFWEDYGNDKQAALACFKEELKTIFAVDKDYIATMIEERKDYISWNESVVPLLNEVLLA